MHVWGKLFLCKRLKLHYFNTQIIILGRLPLIQGFSILIAPWNLLGSIKNINSKATNPLPPDQWTRIQMEPSCWYFAKVNSVSNFPYCNSFISVALTRKLHITKIRFHVFYHILLLWHWVGFGNIWYKSFPGSVV